jgi:hypothetical protein
VLANDGNVVESQMVRVGSACVMLLTTSVVPYKAADMIMALHDLGHADNELSIITREVGTQRGLDTEGFSFVAHLKLVRIT